MLLLLTSFGCCDLLFKGCLILFPIWCKELNRYTRKTGVRTYNVLLLYDKAIGEKHIRSDIYEDIAKIQKETNDHTSM